MSLPNITLISVPKTHRVKAINVLRESDILVDVFFGAKINLELEYQSKMNNEPITFNEDEKWLSDCLKVFDYYNKHHKKFKPVSCSKATGVTKHFVKKIQQKYLLK